MTQVSRAIADREFASIDEANAFLETIMVSGQATRTYGPAPATAAEQAQELVYDAWEIEGPGRVDLAHKALALWSDCADAYVILAEETAATPDEALALYERGVAAGERALGPGSVERIAPNFWSALETRPYMRARAGIMYTLRELERRAEALAHGRELLRLCENDNLGVRYSVLAWSIEEGELDEALALVRRYRDDPSAPWLYGRALALYARSGSTATSRRAMKAAFAANRYVPLVMLGVLEAPEALPANVGFGDPDEAFWCDEVLSDAWCMVDGAVLWMARRVMADFDESKPAKKAHKRR